MQICGTKNTLKNDRQSDEIRLGFDQVRALVAEGCIGEPAKALAAAIRFHTDFPTVVRLQEENEEFRKLLSEGIQIPEINFFDLEPLTKHLEVQGYSLESSEWSRLSRALHTSDSILRTMRKHMARFPRLFALSSKVEIPAEILYRISQVFTEDGDIRDSASPELNRLRKKKIDEQSRLRRKLDLALKAAIGSGFTPDDSGITIRNGRMVIPVLAEFKRRVRGFIHDESATGQTVYIEPEEALEANNEIREIQFAEVREIQKLMMELTDSIRPFKSAIEGAGRHLAQVDLIRSKAKFGLKINACLPASHEGPSFRIFDGRHPLLYLSHKKKGLPLVPLNIWLSEEKRVLIISGPNAGGKSVCLKTVGLIQLMWQSGIPVSVGEGSNLGFFMKVMADIGDQQSIENDLSTYSSHLANMRRMLEEADKSSLVLLDEFGTGTDPALGGPIAEAVLEALCHRKVFGLVNTHYTNLKNFASRHPLCENAAMKFNSAKLEPLFQLEIGNPGSSFALEIAEKTGLPKAVLNQARNKIGAKKLNVDKLIGELESEKQELETRSRELKDREKNAKLLLSENERKSKELESAKNNILNKAKIQATSLLEEANRKIEETIRTIKETQAEKTSTRLARTELAELREKIIPEIQIEPLPEKKDKKSIAAPKIEVVSGEIKLGDLVRIKGTQSAGIVLAFRGKNVEVEIGELRTNLKVEKLEKINRLPDSEISHKRGSLNLGEKMMEFHTQLDIRGLRADEALKKVEGWLDEAMLLGQTELRILHGKGDGILRTQVRNLLRAYRQVGQVRDEHADRGGAGVTLFVLNM